ncbi:MAG: hypothetical protein CSA32_01345 [Desulfobulbus propionicus]|nr:MAG: hypothetical protein CSA32_01345 [Desulfobulbus propionicus]
MSNRTIKKEVLAILSKPDLHDVLSTLESFPAKDVINVLFSAICRGEQTRWFAITCMGSTVARLAKQEMEEGRMIMRRLLWSLNDESGGIGWGAPESMAEIMCAQKQLGQEYNHMLLSYMREDGEELHQDGNFLEHPVLQRGLLWAIGRIGECSPALFKGKLIPDDFQVYFSSSDAQVRGLAAWAAGTNKMVGTLPRLKEMKEEDAPLVLYQHGAFLKTTVSKLIAQALEEIQP